ncbi:MAG: hypothetical protein Q4G58_17295, partial [bacterium]|nr:hypothetical protein [bacterium]
NNKTDNNKVENDKTDNNKKDPSKDVTTVTDGYDKTYSSNKTDTDKNNQASKDSPTTVEQYLEGTVEITNGEEVIFNGELPVKNTGFTIQKGLHIAAVLGVILVMVIAASCKYILFAKKQDGHNE